MGEYLLSGSESGKGARARRVSGGAAAAARAEGWGGDWRKARVRGAWQRSRRRRRAAARRDVDRLRPRCRLGLGGGLGGGILCGVWVGGSVGGWA